MDLQNQQRIKEAAEKYGPDTEYVVFDERLSYGGIREVRANGANLSELLEKTAAAVNVVLLAPKISTLQKLAAGGDLHAIDLQLMDVCEGTISHLQPNTTVANMSKLNEETACADLAAGLCNMIFQAIGVMAVFAAKRHFTRTIVLVGTITDWPIAQRSLDEVAALHHVTFIVPDHAAFATAIGAALSE